MPILFLIKRQLHAEGGLDDLGKIVNDILHEIERHISLRDH